MERFVEVQGVRVPRLMYGTAWKEHRTEALTRLALEAGFRGIDTANQRQHYFEAGVGAAIAAAGIARDELFLQTKFTDVRGQDHRPAIRSGRAARAAGGADVCQLAGAPRGRPCRFVRAARAGVGARLERGRPGGVEHNGAAAPGTAGAAPGSEQHLPGSAGDAVRIGHGPAGVGTEPLLRPDRVGPGGPRGLSRARHRLPGVLPR
jgi:hypothetical protein